MDKNRHIQYYLEFHANSLSDKETETVKNYVQKIIDVGVTEFPPPSIEFPGQNDQQSLTLNLLKWNYYEQKNSKC
uniref:Uncharacterized protein n=1 Tax=Panagrolaimus superbus TaxID=310955 RepID=A0A914Y2V9_9BILA